jgi:hypothetical protein
MKIGYKIALISAIGLLLTKLVPAQEIPLLPSDKSVSQGQLPNGMKYFIVENPTIKGTADFALVNRTDNSMVRKSDIRIAFSESVMDSTLLQLMKAADMASPSDQAIIVSGDVKLAAVAEKIKMLSYMTPVRDTAVRDAYQWQQKDKINAVSTEDDRQLATITATWSAPRTASSLMNTIQPAISSLFTEQMGMIARDRIDRCFRQVGIPAVGIGYKYVDSSMMSEDEKFSVMLSVAPEHVDQAVRILSFVMASIDAGTVTVQEVNRAHGRYVENLYAASLNPLKNNKEFVDRCVSAYLYNGSLASVAQVHAFHASRQLPDETKLSLFNGIASAVLDKETNLTLECTSPEGVDAEKLSESFIAAWDRPSNMEWKDRVETDAFLKTASPEKKMKIGASKKDPMSGASVFTLENGLNLMVRNQPADKRIYFSLALNGGYGNVQKLSAGEGAYFTDYLHTCKVAGVPMRDFLAALAARDVYMDFEVDMTSMSINGSASKYELLTVLQAIALVTSRLEQDDAALEYYLKTVPLQTEALKGTRWARIAAIDAIMCPDYKYSDIKSVIPDEDFGKKAWNFYVDQFAKLDDGVFVITGDVDEAELRKHLAIYGHQFKTLQRASSRPSLRYQPISGVSTYTVKGDADVIDYAMSARCALTSDNHVAAMTAAMAMEQALRDAFEGSGWRVELKEKFTLQPDERFNVMVTLVKVDEDGLETSAAMSRLRATVSAMTSKSLSKNQLSAYAGYLKNHMSLLCTSPSFWTEVIAGRQLYGKDIVTGYSAKCDALTAQKVQNIISSLDKSGKVEYITTKE